MKLPNIKTEIIETIKLLLQFKWYIILYILFYGIILINYLFPSPKNYFLWFDWCEYTQEIYLETTKLLLIIFLLLFFIGTSNMRNHPIIAKLIFLSSLWFGAVIIQ